MLTPTHEDDTMRFLMMIKADQNYEAGIAPDPRLEAAIAEHSEKMFKAGVLLAAEGLLPSAQGAKIRVGGGKLRVTDGPFTEAKELIGGFAIVQAASREEAIRLGSDFMRLHLEILGPGYEGECEVRQLFDAGPGDPVAGCGHHEEIARH
jgi:hypothetical protein